MRGCVTGSRVCCRPPWFWYEVYEVGFGGFTKLYSPFPTDSSKELEELRSMFTRALEYLQQEVEERKWPCLLSARPPCLWLLLGHSSLPGACFAVILIVTFPFGRFQREWGSKLPDHAELGSG